MPPSNDKAQIAQLDDRITAIEAALKRIEEKLTPAAPKPPPAPPKWVAPQGDYGSSFAGPPSETSSGSHDPWGGYRKQVRPDGAWRDPSGIWRDVTGVIITPRSTEPRPVGPERTPEHEMAVRLADALINKESDR
jgi:hypothetical protein